MNIAYKWGYKVITSREYRMKTGIDTNFLPYDIERSVKVKFTVNFQKCAEWPERSSESFLRRKYLNTALNLDPITQDHT